MPAASSDRADVLGLRSLGTLGDVVLDPLAVLEAAVAVGLDGRLVDEDVRCAIVGGDEPVALVRVEPLHCSLSHCALLPRRSSGSTGGASRAMATACPSEARPGNRRCLRSEFRRRCDTDTKLRLQPAPFNTLPWPDAPHGPQLTCGGA